MTSWHVEWRLGIHRNFRVFKIYARITPAKVVSVPVFFRENDSEVNISWSARYQQRIVLLAFYIAHHSCKLNGSIFLDWNALAVYTNQNNYFFDVAPTTSSTPEDRGLEKRECGSFRVPSVQHLFAACFLAFSQTQRMMNLLTSV